MEQKQITLEEVYRRLLALESALKSKGITLSINPNETDDEGDIADEFKALIEKRRKSSRYIPHEEVKRRISSKK